MLILSVIVQDSIFQQILFVVTFYGMETNAPVLFMLVVNIIVERDFLNNFNNCPMFNILSIPYLSLRLWN